MAAHSPPNPDVEGCFEVTLARGLNMTRKRLPIQTALSNYKRRFSSLADHQRLELAAALQWEYRRRSVWVEGDERALRLLNEQYSDAQCFVTPVHRLPVEILMKIFHIIVGDQPPPIGLMLVRRRWNGVIEAMSGLQFPLELRTWTSPDIVRRALSAVASRLFNITIDTDKDGGLRVSSVEPYSALVIAADCASQWRSLTVHSLPSGAQLHDRPLHTLLPTHIPSMNRLEEFKITSELEPSPLADHLLQNIGATAMRGLITIETKSLYAIRILLQATPTNTFRSLTTLKVMVRKTSEPIDLLSHLTKLEVLEATNLLLPSYQNDFFLPFVHTLRHLYLKAVSIEWMAGRAFPHLGTCTIITPSHPFLASDVDLPTCGKFHFHHQCTISLRRFQMPMVSSLVINGNHWSPLQGSQSLVHLCMAGLGVTLQPRVLHLTMLFKGSTLLLVLKQLPALEELFLELPRPSALGKGFFTALLAQPAQPLPTLRVGESWVKWAEGQNDWHVTLCPSLRVFKLKYQRWLRSSEPTGIVAPLLALGWTRQKIAIPLHANSIHMKTRNGDWNSFELVPAKPSYLTMLGIPHLQSLMLNEETLQDLINIYLTSVALNVIEARFYGHSLTLYLSEALYGPFFHRLRVLRLRNLNSREATTLTVLHCFHHLEELLLLDIIVPLYRHDVELSLFRTLKRLSIFGGCVKWLDGHTFVQLTSFCVSSIRRWRRPFPDRVRMPVCTHIDFMEMSLKYLPLFRASFDFPFLDKWEMRSATFAESDFQSAQKSIGMEALKQVHAKVLCLSTYGDLRGFIRVIMPRYELKGLSIRISASRNIQEVHELLIALTETIVDYPVVETTNTSFDSETVRAHSIATDICTRTERKIICPNLEAIDIEFDKSLHQEKEEARRRCVEMMEGRRLAGCPLRRCCIWWDWNYYEKDPSLVLITSDEGIIMDE